MAKRKPFNELTWAQKTRLVSKLLRRGELSDYPDIESWAIRHGQTPRGYA